MAPYANVRKTITDVEQQFSLPLPLTATTGLTLGHLNSSLGAHK